jgi:hypothetical protein
VDIDRIATDNLIYSMQNFIELDLPIGHLENLLSTFDIEVSSPDGWVPVTKFINKGDGFDEYVLETTTHDRRIRVSGNHLFETEDGWRFAADLEDQTVSVLTSTGYQNATIISTGRKIPVVDITVEHENHRYFTDGVSSHNSGGGKSLAMCDVAASHLRRGKNVLYITLELAEERIAERIDANLMNVEVNRIKEMSRDEYITKIDNIAAKSHGKLFIKEYPPGSAHAGHFRALIEELKVKKNFVPDIIYIDYLGICASSRVKMNGSMNSYSYLKYVSEELRGLGVEFDVPVVTAGQVNRSGFATSDFDLTSISDSMGIVHTCDLILGIIRTEELDELGQIMWKQLKNRFGDIGYYTRFVVGVNRAKMKLYDLEAVAQSGISQTSSRVATEAEFSGRTKKIATDNFQF